MKVKCKSNQANYLSEKVLESSATNSTIFPLEIEKIYVVYSICLWEGILKFLTVGEEILPSWHPAELFDVVDKVLPLEWYCDVRSGEELEAIWGYREIVLDEDHYDGLAEREDDAVRIFLKRKKEIEEYFEG